MSLQFALLFAISFQPVLTQPDSAADSVTLSDGRVVLGQILAKPVADKPCFVILRRAWAREHFADRMDEWQTAESRWALPARTARLTRLREWKQDRTAHAPAEPDSLAASLDAEIHRLETASDRIDSPLLVLRLDPAEIRQTHQQSPAAARRLRQGWLSGFEHVEEMPLDRLTTGLESRGFAADSNDIASIETILPIPPESDAAWFARRAATEVTEDTGLRFLRYGNFVLPEPSDPTELPSGAVTSLLGSTLRSLLDEGPGTNPLEEIGRSIEAKKRVGLVVTEVEIGQLDRSTVKMTLYARLAPERWEPVLTKSTTTKAEAGQGADLAADPQVDAVFKLLDSIAPGGAVDAKRMSLSIGSATQSAIGKTREAFELELSRLAISLEPPPAAAPKP
jgi:hypothetical protein